MTPFTERIIEEIRPIQEVKVMTYGGIIAAAGSPKWLDSDKNFYSAL